MGFYLPGQRQDRQGVSPIRSTLWPPLSGSLLWGKDGGPAGGGHGSSSRGGILWL